VTLPADISRSKMLDAVVDDELRAGGDRRWLATLVAPIGGHPIAADSTVTATPGNFRICSPSIPGPASNEVLLTRSDDANTLIDTTIAEDRAHGSGTKWCVGSFTRPSTIAALLADRRFESWGARGMACDPAATQLAVPESVHVAASGALDDVIAATTHDGFESPDTLRGPITAGLRRAPADVERRWFLARLDGRPAGSASTLIMSLDGHRYAYLGGASVLPSFRGRGVYRALVGARLRELASQGIELAVTQAREATSAPRLEHLGFETVLSFDCFYRPFV